VPPGNTPHASGRAVTAVPEDIMPFYRFKIDALLSPGEAMRRMQSLVRTDPGLRVGWFAPRVHDAVPFVGRVEDNEFRIYRLIRYRNSFLPQMRGIVNAMPTGIRVSVTMSLHPLAAIFMVVWLSAVGMAAMVALAHWGTSDFRIEPVAMFVVGLAMTLGGFYPEAYKARRLLERALS
jgi:hypothetical protein